MLWTVTKEERTVLDKGGRKRREVLCRCRCGTQRWVRRHRVERGLSTSCGCTRSADASARFTKASIGEKSTVSEVYNDYRRNAKKRSLEWQLTPGEFSALIHASCSYCGAEHSMKTKGYKHVLLRNGIDRVDNAVGYLVSNCVTACKTCNWAKGSMTQRSFISWAGRVAQYLRKEAAE